jgi:hypothetical protein
MQLKLDKTTKEVELEAYDNPWKLLNLIDHPAK